MTKTVALHVLYLALSLLFASRVFTITRPTSHAMLNGDPACFAWSLQWMSHALVHKPLHLYAGNTFYPYERSIALTEPNVTLAVLNVPVRWFTSNPWVGYNLLIVAAYYLSCVWGAALVREITGSEIAAVWGGLFWGFLFFRMHHIGHLNILSFQFIPAALLGLIRLWQRPGLRSASLFTLAFVSQTLVSWYLGVIMSVVLLVVAAFRPPRETLSRKVLGWYLAMAVTTAAVVLPFALPYRSALADSSLADRQLGIDTKGDAVALRDYFTPPRATLAGKLVKDNPYEIWGENTLYVGYVPLLLAALAIGDRRRWRNAADRRWIATGLTLMVVGYVLALGFVSPGWGVRLPLHYAASVWPVLGALRSTQRFSLEIYAGVLFLSGLGMARLVRNRPSRSAVAVGTVVAVAFLLEVFPVTLPVKPDRPYAPSAPDRFIALYQGTRAQPLVVLHLPIYYFSESYAVDEATYMVDSTWHWARILNGFSGGEPAGFMERMRVLNGLPDPPAVELIRKLGVDVIAVHRGANVNALREFFSRQEWASIVGLPSGEFVVLLKR